MNDCLTDLNNEKIYLEWSTSINYEHSHKIELSQFLIENEFQIEINKEHSNVRMFEIELKNINLNEDETSQSGWTHRFYFLPTGYKSPALNGWEIAGIVIGVLVFIGIIAILFIIFIFIKRKISNFVNENLK